MDVDITKFCPNCWAAAGGSVTRCPVCDHEISPRADSNHSRGAVERSSEFRDLTVQESSDEETDDERKRSPFLLIAVLIVLILSGVGVTTAKSLLTPRFIDADFLGEWVTIDPEEIADLTVRVDTGREIVIKFWEENGDIITDIPAPGEVKFEKEPDINHLKGIFTMAFTEDETSPVVAELSRDKKKMTIYFRMNDLATRPDIILHLKRP